MQTVQMPMDQLHNADDNNHGKRQPPAEIDGMLINRPRILIPRRRVTKREHDHHGNCRKYHIIGEIPGDLRPPLFFVFTLCYSSLGFLPRSKKTTKQQAMNTAGICQIRFQSCACATNQSERVNENSSLPAMDLPNAFRSSFVY